MIRHQYTEKVPIPAVGMPLAGIRNWKMRDGCILHVASHVREAILLHMMKIFIGMKVPRTNKKLRLAADLLVATVKLTGHDPFLATDEIAWRNLTDPYDFMPFVRDRLRCADLLILLNNPELRGGLIEAGMAYAWDIPIWLFHKPAERVSSSLRGCADVTIEYRTLDDLRDKLSGQLLSIVE